jgi:GT2 family glycosyltransferase
MDIKNKNMNISLLVGLKNNLDYNKYFYSTTRTLYPEVEICFASYGSTDGTHEWLDSLNDPNLKYYYSEENKTFSDTFNKAAEIATNDYVVYLHNDIVLAPNFLENIEKHLGDNNIVAYTTIEPPIFSDHERPGKIVKDFGSDLETFNLPELCKFVLNEQGKCKNQTEPGITFFMCMPKATLLKIGGLDNLFNPMFCEDDDLILRFKLLGLNLFTSLDAICYHFVSKTSRFSEENKNRTQTIEINSNKNFIRKWGFRNSQHNKKYNIAFIVKNCNYDMLATLEPWCDRIYINDEMGVLQAMYYENEHKTTSYDLKKRILNIGYNDPKGENDIIVEFDGIQLNQTSFNIIQNLSDIITESGAVGEFELDIFKITINQIESITNNLIFISNN